MDYCCCCCCCRCYCCLSRDHPSNVRPNTEWRKKETMPLLFPLILVFFSPSQIRSLVCASHKLGAKERERAKFFIQFSVSKRRAYFLVIVGPTTNSVYVKGSGGPLWILILSSVSLTSNNKEEEVLALPTTGKNKM